MTATRPLRAVYAMGNGTDVLDGAQAPSELAAPARPPAPEREELGAVIDEFMLAAEEGALRDAFGRPYTPDSLRELHSALSHVKSELGTVHVGAIRRWQIQGMLDELRRGGLAPGRLAAVVEALHSVFTYAIERGLVEDTPVIWLTSPEQGQRAETVTAPAAQRSAPAPAPEPLAAEAPTTPTSAMVALGSSVLLWTVRATVTVFVLIVIVLLVGFA
jgi:hypothetical protein